MIPRKECLLVLDQLSSDNTILLPGTTRDIRRMSQGSLGSGSAADPAIAVIGERHHLKFLQNPVFLGSDNPCKAYNFITLRDIDREISEPDMLQFKGR